MKPELLAPAGGREQLEYAIRFGADAVYMAGPRFGMRAHADNFTLTELSDAVAYAHDHGVKVHLTCNTMVHEHELGKLVEYLQAYDASGADALIIGDMGVFMMAKEHAPHCQLHVSTQASVCNFKAALAWYELGAKRIVCAREMSLAQIASMRQEIPNDLELECFVHGSMCMAYSGRCLISDYLTGRSALQGDCTQSCRWNYTLMEEKRPGEYMSIQEDERGSYLLNAQDLNMLAHLQEIQDAGVDSIKIEGRNKKASYVATVVNAYRQVLDGAPWEQFEAELDTTSHRPFSTGFFFGPAHQAPHESGYKQTHEWVAEVMDCKPASEGEWKALLRCRNHFEEGDELHVLSPSRPVIDTQIRDLQLIGPDGDLDSVGIPVQVANRTRDLYAIRCSAELHRWDLAKVCRVSREDRQNAEGEIPSQR